MRKMTVRVKYFHLSLPRNTSKHLFFRLSSKVRRLIEGVLPPVRGSHQLVWRYSSHDRVARCEIPEEGIAPFEKYRIIDIVHKDFLQGYIKNLLSFTNKVSSLILKHQKVLASGKGFISGMGKSSSIGYEGRLKPR